MVFKDAILKIVTLSHRTGKARATGNPYDFYTLELVDEDYNKFETTLGEGDLGNLEEISSWAKNKNDVVCDVVIGKGEGRAITMRIENIRPEN